MLEKNKKYGVIGGSTGLGGWFVKFLKDEKLNVAFSSRNKEKGMEQENKTNTKWFNSNIKLVENCDILILAVPINQMIKTLEEIFPYLENKTIVEICSVKKFIVNRFLELQKEKKINLEYHSIHPMFGETIKSVEGKVFIYNYSNIENSKFLKKFKKTLEEKKAKQFFLEYNKHDKTMAVVQGLNHFNIFVSAKTLNSVDFHLIENKVFSSPSYRIFLVFFTRYTLQNAKLYAEIQMYNDEILPVLREFKKETDKLLEIIEKKQESKFVEYIEEMKPQFEINKKDFEISNKLIEYLGRLISEE